MLVFDVSAIRYGAGVGDRAEQAMAGRVAEFEVVGPWSLETSRRFWEGFPPQRWRASRPRRGCARCFVPRGIGAAPRRR